jgi:hypothetical protein
VDGVAAGCLLAAEAEREKSGTGTPIFFDHVAGDAMEGRKSKFTIEQKPESVF